MDTRHFLSNRIVRFPALLALWLVMTTWVFSQPTLTWTAFNDHFAGPGTSPNATAWNVFGTQDGAPGNSGPLQNIATGAALPVTLTIDASGSVGGGTTAGAPDPNTPAYSIFNGYIDWGNGGSPHAPQVYPGAEVNYIFTGLDPRKRYGFVGSSVRGGNYPLRWSLIELLGADSSTPAHTTGAAAYTNGLSATQVAINSGQNRATGDYADWENINPGADGTFTVRCSFYDGPTPNGTAGGPYCYSLMAIRLQEFNVTPVPAAISVQPTNQSIVELSPVTFRVVAAGSPPPTCQWYRNGLPIPQATNDTYTIPAVVLGDDNARFFVVASNWVKQASCLATSAVATLTVVADTTPPALLRVLPAANTTISSLRSIEVFFDKLVTGVTAADLLINGAPATNVDLITPAQYFFELSQPPAGTIQVAWSTSHHITDTTESANRFPGGSWSYRLDTNIIFSVRINEFMAANKHVARDEDGDYSDWIELYNSGNTTVALDGCYLTDDNLERAKWQFPAVSITPNSYLMVWASGKNRAVSTSPLHANFKLSQDGGYLALVLPDGTNIVSAFSPAYPPQRTDVSYGCDRTDPSRLGYFPSPTPGAANSTSGSGFGPEVRFSRDGGPFTTAFSLVLSTTSTNAIIYYTLGTNAPTTSSTVYTGPIAINKTVQVRARALVPGLFLGDIQSKDYVLLDNSMNNLPGSSDNVMSFHTPLPIVVFHNNGGGSVPYSDPGQFAMIQVFEPKNGRSSLTNIPDLTVQGTIHRRGQATRWLPKMNLRVETIDEYGGNKNVPLLGFPADNDWVFYAINGYDKVLMHNPLAHELYSQLGRYTSRTRFVEVFIKQDSGSPGPITANDYYGLYVVEEKIKIGLDRVNIDKLQPENTNAPSVTGGYLFSIDKDGPAPGFNAANTSMWYLDPDGPTISTPQRAPQRQYINNYLNTFYTALTGPNWTNPAAGYAAYIDVPAWIDYHLHQVLVFNADMLRISSYYAKPRDGKITPAALWDFDRAFAMYSADGDQRGFNPWRWRGGTMDGGTDPFNAANTYSNPWYGKLFTDPDFWQKWIDRYQELRQTVYSGSNITALIDRLGDEVAETTPREYARWAGSGSSDTTPNAGTTTGDGWTYTFPIPGTWPAEVQFVKIWFTNRMVFMDTNFLARPTVSQPGGQVTSGYALTISPASKTGSSVLYTLDGTDPRLPGGAISSSALSSSRPATIIITNNIRLFARSWNPNHRNLTGANNPPISSPWSGVTTDTYYTSIPALQITEIMYHPGRAPTGSTNDAADFEYLELANTGNTTLNLPGIKFTAGIGFTFAPTNRVTALAPGARVLVVRNYAAFVSRYPAAAALVAGEFGGSLNNAGDHLALAGPLGEPIQDVSYDNQWYPVTDGLGFSLVAADKTTLSSTWTNPVQWRPSAYDGGSPGLPDPAPVAVQPVIVNEILAHPIPPADDTIEFWNPNATPADVGYWWLTDNLEAPRKYLVPPGTIVPGFGFFVLHKTNSFGVPGFVNALGATNAPFSLNADGEAVYLFSGDATGRLTGYYQGSDYGPTAPGVTVGRYANSISQITYAAQSANTLGTTNAYPLVGPVVLSELMYHPPDLIIGGLATENARDEFIELHNNTGQPLPLFDTNNPANTWHLRDGVRFDFPPAVVLPPFGYLLVVGFSPAADPASLAAFQARYALSNNVPVYGPFDGRLNNGGEQIDLRRPGAPNPVTLNVSMILVDRLRFGVTNPWPAIADGAGASLQRKDFTAFGDDPVNWIGAAPSPGRGQPLLITASPQPQTVVEDSTATFDVTVSGAGPFEYQWLFQDTPITGGTGPSLRLANVQLSQAGDYSVMVQSPSGTASSAAARLTVLALPVITQQPADVTVNEGGVFGLNVAARGTGALGYQWQFNSADINGATSDTFAKTNAQFTDAGAYRVRVTDSVGTRTSRAAQVTVLLNTVRVAVELQRTDVVISWLDSQGGVILEETTDLTPPVIWRPSALMPANEGGRWQIVAPILSTTNTYFRLKRSP